MGLAYRGLTHCDRCGSPLKDNEFVTCKSCSEREKSEANVKIEHKIEQTLENTSNLEGIVCIADLEHELGIKAKYMNDYLALKVLAELLKKNKAEIIFKVGREDKDMKYLLKLLKEGEK